MNTSNAPQVTKAIKGKKTIYTANGVTLRTSTRDYKFALFGLCHHKYNPTTCKVEEVPAEWRIIGFGNNATNLLNSWKNIFHADAYEIVTIQ